MSQLSHPPQIHTCDIIIVGAGIAGLWLGARLKRAGYDVVLIEENAVGGVQTLASQGMIHGGQKFVLSGTANDAAKTASTLPARWEACFGGYGDVDLTAARFISEDQVMWPAADKLITEAAVYAAAHNVNAGMQKLKPKDYPPVLADMRAAKKFRGPVYRLPEKVMDIKSLVRALAEPLKGRILKGAVTEVLPDGQIAVSGHALSARAVIFAGGKGNEKVFDLLKIKQRFTQRRPLRQVMVKPLPFALNGHGIVAHPKPRATVTSHPLGDGTYVWYLGGNVSEEGASLSAEETLKFAKATLQDMFPLIDWDDKLFATWAGDRAEPFDEQGHLPAGPHIHQRGNILVTWPVKLTFAPALADKVVEWLDARGLAPREKQKDGASLPPLPQAEVGLYPWETETFRKV